MKGEKDLTILVPTGPGKPVLGIRSVGIYFSGGERNSLKKKSGTDSRRGRKTQNLCGPRNDKIECDGGRKVFAAPEEIIFRHHNIAEERLKAGDIVQIMVWIWSGGGKNLLLLSRVRGRETKLRISVGPIGRTRSTKGRGTNQKG